MRRNRVAPAAGAGVLYAASLWLSNSAYLYLSVSFIQMTKSLMPGLVYATGIGLGTERFTRANAATMALIAAGVVVCAIGEVNLVPKGVLQQLAALLFEARRHRRACLAMQPPRMHRSPPGRPRPRACSPRSSSCMDARVTAAMHA